jgi:hypothetical protein
MSPGRKKHLMARFCLATWKLDPAVAGTGEAAEPIAALGADTIAVEVVNEGEEFAVLFSVVDRVDRPENLECRIGFANGTKACSVWRDRGFPLVDATIEWKGDLLQVTTPFFGADPGTMQYEGLFISIKGIHFQEGVDPKEMLGIYYSQYQEAPDSVSPATIVCRRGIKWRPDRSKIVRSKLESSALTLAVTSCRSPNLRPLQTGAIDGVYMWSGTVDLSTASAIPDAKTLRVNRADTFGVPAFRFENVEVLGFRLELSTVADIQRRLADLIEPLNFHLSEPGSGISVPDFRYRAATPTVLVELLRYGRMKLKSEESPLTILDYQSQHELVVRILVGRVDDDTAQARDAATYVPAIFVDNPWSKTIGRDLQGFAKCMANFCTERDGKHVPLRPDGRFYGGGDEVPLTAVSRISLAERTDGGATSGDKDILDIGLPPEVVGSEDGFEHIDLDLALSSFALSDTRWRQSDFDQAEFRRSFAGTAIRETMRGFRSVQVSPVKDRGLPRTWISGTFSIDDDLQLATPAGGASLTFHCPAKAPREWRKFCSLLDVNEEQPGLSRVFVAGNWYRLKFSTSLTIDNGLDWTDT